MDENDSLSTGDADDNDSFTTVNMDGKSEDEVNHYIHEFSLNPFKEIFDSPLYEFQLLRTANELLVLGRVHHLIMDGTSLSILAKKLEDCVQTLKKGEEYQFIPVSYQEYVEKEKEYLSSGEAQRDEEFWLSNLDGYHHDWYSSLDRSINREYFHLDKDLRHRLKDLYSVGEERVSPFVLALSLVSLYFARSNHAEDLVWNSVYHGRDFGEDTRDMLGMFVNMMPLRLGYDENRTFEEVLLTPSRC
jgi:Non-ribosomal peptide synthetase modules and related proteins